MGIIRCWNCDHPFAIAHEATETGEVIHTCGSCGAPWDLYDKAELAIAERLNPPFARTWKAVLRRRELKVVQ